MGDGRPPDSEGLWKRGVTFSPIKIKPDMGDKFESLDVWTHANVSTGGLQLFSSPWAMRRMTHQTRCGLEGLTKHGRPRFCVPTSFDDETRRAPDNQKDFRHN